MSEEQTMDADTQPGPEARYGEQPTQPDDERTQEERDKAEREAGEVQEDAQDQADDAAEELARQTDAAEDAAPKSSGTGGPGEGDGG